MCTVSLITHGDSSVLTMNRDEQRHRREGGLVRKSVDNGEICFPVDLQAGGSWVGFNSHGVAIALLNRYNAPSVDGVRSRGLLVTDALAAGNYETVLEHMSSINPTQYNPFDMLVVSANHEKDGVQLFSWDRTYFHSESRDKRDPLMLTSTSLFYEEARQHRKNRFVEWLDAYGDAESVDLFHLEQVESQESLAVLVSRERTHTKSVVQIHLNPSSGNIAYYDENTIKPNARLEQLTPSASVRLGFLEPCGDFSKNKSESTS